MYHYIINVIKSINNYLALSLSLFIINVLNSLFIRNTIVVKNFLRNELNVNIRLIFLALVLARDFNV